MRPVNLFDYEKLAQERLEPAIWDFYHGGSDDEVTLRECRRAFERIRLRPRVLVDVSTIEMRTTVLGTPVSMPILIAPTAAHGLAHAHGEVATVRAAGQSETLMIVSTTAALGIAEVAAAASGPLWFQLYTHHSLEITGKLVRQAEELGYRAIALTVDIPRLGNRERDLYNKFVLEERTPLPNYPSQDITALERHMIDTWETVDWLRATTKLPILLKGILTAEDALLAIEHKVAGIIVSNHGGRQLDGAIPSIEALPEVVEAVKGRCEVYVDGGIRRGTDILKALALGARAVLIGRPIIWGLAVDGQQGVLRVLEILRNELEMAMALAGRPNLASIDPSLLKL
ncbi:alpha-hydroxy-acid oxidizing protein [Ktedonosporobacter rubrisoli]|uniref:Alpha-hydroxy-acid oxidizing protein n=1 Tax=Ktedonosporobacter rubrisoli TaxID=2509675 RepID=A0A4P6JU29_KTERU|nr:alpha-hydroxy acid oxidase [Ktedonosporobacter rubrisoli]QBD79118.1 alpha-hydroxy-acid oxidizing protein [Ktedonosporobacter rubrisoli]